MPKRCLKIACQVSEKFGENEGVTTTYSSCVKNKISFEYDRVRPMLAFIVFNAQNKFIVIVVCKLFLFICIYVNVASTASDRVFVVLFAS